MAYLLSETRKALKSNSRKEKDVDWVGTMFEYMTWNEFVIKSNKLNYDNGFGGAEINEGLLVVGKDFWLERHEYDGSEWWEFKTMPKKPDKHNDCISLKDIW